ncbi:MAG: hypothetical protein IPL51_10190 [Candidatus Competibacteraceae bacterium]|nr:hypothetical protein [Candidatus Competibacteraceae bacterium]
MAAAVTKAVPVAPGFPQFAGVWTPAVWASDILVHFYETSVLPAISNTKYEGLISGKGDRVIIRVMPDVVWKPYAKGQSLIYDDMTPGQVELVVDKAEYWGAKIDDIDKMQSDIDWLDKFTMSAAETGKINVDKAVLGSFYADVSSENSGSAAGAVSGSLNLGETGAPLAMTKLNVTDIIVDAETVLDEQKAPQIGRWMVLPPILTNLLRKSELKDASLTGDGTSILRNGRVGMVGNFTIYTSTLLPWVMDGANRTYHIPFGTKDALTFAAQIPPKNVERLRSEQFFGTLVRGLMVYGFEVLYPDMVGSLYAYKA